MSVFDTPSTSIPVKFNPVTGLPTNYNLTQTAPTLADLKNAVTTDYLKNSNVESELGMGWFIKTAPAEDKENGKGSLAKIFKPLGNGLVDIVKDFQWTVTPTLNRSDIPYVQLNEHKVEGGQIQKQLEFYLNGLGDAFKEGVNAGGASKGILEVYDEIFIRNPTDWRYKFPYFAEVHYEISTPAWAEFGKLGDQVKGIGSGLGKLGKLGADVFDFFGASLETASQLKYPVTGIADRPRIFTSHGYRSIKIEFPLYNTVEAWKWQQNREFIHLFHSQNLFNKRNFATGLPPVWYEVFVPGEYYSVASCVTNFSVKNLGNTRIERGRDNKDVIVPDAYQISITLEEMAMPSKNQFQAALDGTGSRRVNATTVTTAPAATTPKSSTPTQASLMTSPLNADNTPRAGSANMAMNLAGMRF